MSRVGRIKWIYLLATEKYKFYIYYPAYPAHPVKFTLQRELLKTLRSLCPLWLKYLF